MKALLARPRLFVLALMEQGDINYTKAAQAAGYGRDSETGLAVTAHRLAHDPRVLAAVREESERRIRAGISMAASKLVSIANNDMHKDQLKAVTSLLNRGGLSEMIEHKHTLEVGQDVKALLARIGNLSTQLGMDPVKVLGTVGMKQLEPPKPADHQEVEDAEFEEIPSTIEDWSAL